MATRWSVRDNVQASGKPQDSRRDTWCLQTRGRKYCGCGIYKGGEERREQEERRTRKRRKTKNREQNNSAETVISSGQGH